MKLFKKTALAVALTASATGSVVAADLEFASAAPATGVANTVVLADVIFGNGNPGVGSEETLITAPYVDFDLAVATVAPAGGAGDNIVDGGTSTIKFTLGGGAVFGEDLSTTALATPFISATDDSTAGVTIEVEQGGAVGDNTITFTIENADANGDGSALNLSTIMFGGYAVKNLTSALNPDSAAKRVQMGVEYVEATVGADDLDEVATTATDLPLTVFGSQAPVDVTVTPTLNLTNNFRINVGTGETTFTDTDSDITTGEDGRPDFELDGDVTVVNLGTVQLNREVISATAFPAAPNGELIKKENGDDFDFQGGDSHSVTFNLDSGALQVGSSIYLSTAADCSTAFGNANIISDEETTSVTVGITGNTTQLTSAYNVCYAIDDEEVIPEVGAIDATWNVDFFNQRYDNVEVTDGSFGPLLRNGCIASFFNVPASGNADTAYIRLTNTSNVNEGYIRGTLYAQDGEVLGQDVTIQPEDVAVHATQIFSTEGANRTTGAGEEIIDIETAFDVDGADYKGRARLVLKGAFDTCEGQGLIRTAGGSLFNMTSTTQGNDTGVDGNNGN
ncbi:hypothetical protein [Alteromonas sp. S015]|uniref:hypothetical protein n=1 Tax=Alteromonas sp. S015 TaxID=3117401 RepID=UPI002FE0CB0D